MSAGRVSAGSTLLPASVRRVSDRDFTSDSFVSIAFVPRMAGVRYVKDTTAAVMPVVVGN
jgi:hypothetical protein